MSFAFGHGVRTVCGPQLGIVEKTLEDERRGPVPGSSLLAHSRVQLEVEGDLVFLPSILYVSGECYKFDRKELKY